MDHNAVKKTAERFSPIPQKVIRHLITEGILTETLDRDHDIEALELLHRIWADATILRSQLATLPKKRRLNLIETADLNRWETYVFSRYKNSSGRLPVDRVAGEVEATFGVKINDYIRARIERIRKKVQNARYYKKAAGRNNKQGRAQQ
ncbi:hypothetical protein [Geobacter anodireducens]|uniref:Uncharacterized protein n=1 Tax=Geobacter soli TaxID=1510391 RepID=A0A0C1U8N1_9BACT|nr:hypothetical protein [Geobacter soli]KIE43935.1 hypothetical protein SE37_15540 [Geobacter soli]